MPRVNGKPEAVATDIPGGPEAYRRRMYWLLGLTFVHVFGEGGLALYEAVDRLYPLPS